MWKGRTREGSFNLSSQLALKRKTNHECCRVGFWVFQARAKSKAKRESRATEMARKVAPFQSRVTHAPHSSSGSPNQMKYRNNYLFLYGVLPETKFLLDSAYIPSPKVINGLPLVNRRAVSIKVPSTDAAPVTITTSQRLGFLWRKITLPSDCPH